MDKVNTIIVNKNKLPFLWHLFWEEKHLGECMNKKQSILVLLHFLTPPLVRAVKLSAAFFNDESSITIAGGGGGGGTKVQ